MITGEGGLGKTYTVTKTLEANGYKDISDLADFQVGSIINTRKCFTMIKGFSTAKGLYRTLFENNKSIVVFDDCDAVLKDPVALNLLKGALDSYGKRIISWNADMKDDDLPRSFEFTGRVIFISNMDQDRIDQAIRSRSMMIDLSMTLDQKIDRMEFIDFGVCSTLQGGVGHVDGSKVMHHHAVDEADVIRQCQICRVHRGVEHVVTHVHMRRRRDCLCAAACSNRTHTGHTQHPNDDSTRHDSPLSVAAKIALIVRRAVAARTGLLVW